MDILASELGAEPAYKLMTGIVVPRPIAWVCTLSSEGVLNLAPFSAFTFVSTKPPMIGISVGRKAGRRKDTAANIYSRGEFVVHIANQTLLDPLHESAVEHPPEVSEVDLLGLTTTPSTLVSVPRLVAPSVAMECKLHQVIAFGSTGSEFMVGEVVAFHIDDALMENGKIDSMKLNPICRLAGPNYATLGQLITKRALIQTEKSVLPGPSNRT
jgi:flavin reductase (DIM6/NTAB) family NADH-FMN oxidoreductase RutF